MAGEGFRAYAIGKTGNLVLTSVQSPDFETGTEGWQVRKSGSAEFNDVTIRDSLTIGGTTLIYSTPSGTVSLFLSEAGTPLLSEAASFLLTEAMSPGGGTPELIASVSGTAGTDPFGNAYLAGIVSYRFSGLTWVNLNGGQINFSSGAGIAGDSAGELVLGTTGTQFVSIPFPISDALVPSEPGTVSTPETWHPITLDAGWTATVTPQYRMLIDGNVQVRGQASHAGTTAATNINNSHPVPFEYWPAAERVYRPPDAGDSAGTVQISAAGVFAMRASGFSAVQAIFDGIYSI